MCLAETFYGPQFRRLNSHNISLHEAYSAMMYICRHINHDTHKSKDNTAIDGLVKIVEVCITFPDAAMSEKGHSRLFDDLE